MPRILHGQWVPGIEKTECNASDSRRQEKVPESWVKKGFFVLLRRGSQVHQRQMADTPGQICGGGWLEPWVKEKAT